ncbi:MAG: efflux RND transporter periplasmic adaptor subunit [Deltaproteobacteria bacterium]|nr:efflux RND transporter periplasmic adaptor subunit [Myxococcales bacterium]TDJ10811.1 MAG: efflux RND transporter periplasmic adaptor subunit [Deltaproteobacteria bacterium]TDJ20843.1 MAG: efflux RND transporter periplasmic adaptor subunit [Deltaproteobacteria bacterium]
MGERSLTLRTGLFGAAGILFVGGLVLMLLAPDPEKIASAGVQNPPREIRVTRIVLQPVRARVERSSILEPRRSVRVFAETRGPVIEVGAEALDRVEVGQLLLRIDPLQAEVAIEGANANVARSLSELALARSNLKRRRSLSKRNVTSAAELENAENQEKVALAMLRQSRAELKQAKDDLENKTIKAPFTGVLRSFDVELGEYVQEGQELGELLDLSAARTVIGLADSEIVAVRAGQRVDVEVEALPGEMFQGEVLRVGAASDPRTRRFPVEIEIPNPEMRLLSGMVARVGIDLEEERLRMLIPREVTIDEFGLRFVWVVERVGNERLVRRRRIAVRSLAFRPADFEVVSGLAVGEEIAVTSMRRLREDETVHVGGVTSP